MSRDKRRYNDAKNRRGSGRYVPLMYRVIRSRSFASLSPYAIKLLVDLLSQYRGNNNGDLCIAWRLMLERGWKSKATLEKARKELLTADWIEVSRQGGVNRPSLYGLTFYALDDCEGKLDIHSTISPKDTWMRHEAPPSLKAPNRKLSAPARGSMPVALPREAYQ